MCFGSLKNFGAQTVRQDSSLIQFCHQRKAYNIQLMTRKVRAVSNPVSQCHAEPVTLSLSLNYLLQGAKTAHPRFDEPQAQSRFFRVGAFGKGAVGDRVE